MDCPVSQLDRVYSLALPLHSAGEYFFVFKNIFYPTNMLVRGDCPMLETTQASFKAMRDGIEELEIDTPLSLAEKKRLVVLFKGMTSSAMNEYAAAKGRECYLKSVNKRLDCIIHELAGRVVTRSICCFIFAAVAVASVLLNIYLLSAN